jgi:SAM-dependent methyltransferase
MKPLTILLLFLTLGNFSLGKEMPLPAPTDYTPIITWYAALYSIKNEPTPAPSNDEIKVGDKCIHCKGTGTLTLDGGNRNAPCHHCKADGVANEGDPIITGNYTQEPEVPQAVPFIEKPLVPPVVFPPEKPVLDLPDRVWCFIYQGSTYYYDPETDIFVSKQGKKFKIDIPQTEWMKEGFVKICTHDATGRQIKCEPCKLFQVDINADLIPKSKPITRLNTHTNSEVQTADQYATPQASIDRMLSVLNPQPHETFLDVGSGDGRAVITAAKNYGCYAIGIEIDPDRIQLAYANAEEAGVANQVEFIQGDFKQIEWPQADVGFVYLFPEDLYDIRNRLLGLDRFASYVHQVPNLPMYSKDNGDFYLWDYNDVFTVWNGRTYQGPPCSKPGCTMCNSIRASIAEQKSHHLGVLP